MRLLWTWVPGAGMRELRDPRSWPRTAMVGSDMAEIGIVRNMKGKFKREYERFELCLDIIWSIDVMSCWTWMLSGTRRRIFGIRLS